MTTEREALKLALEALYNMVEDGDVTDKRQALEAITAIKEALAQPEQEPVGFAVMERPWVGLTDEEIDELFEDGLGFEKPRAIYREIEAKLKEKNA